MKNPFGAIDEKTLEYRARKASILKNNPNIQRLLKGQKNPDELIEKNLEVLSSWLDEQERCFHCQGLSFCPKARNSIAGHTSELMFDQDGFINQVLVECRYQKEKNASRAHLKKIWINQMDSDAQLADLGKLDLKIESMPYVQSYMNLLGSVNTDFGIYLYGQAGVGKSFLLSGLANKYAREGSSVCFVRCPQLISDIKDHFNDDDYRREMLWNLSNCNVLFLDDIGSEASSAWARDDILFPVLDFRLNHHKKTYFSSNLSMEELARQYVSAREHNSEVAVSRLMDRIRAMAMPNLLQGESRRKSPSPESLNQNIF